MLTIDVGSPGGEWGYPIHVGHGILPQLGRRCKELDLGPRGAVVADAALGSRVDAVVEILREAGFDMMTVPLSGGDAGKNLRSAEQIFGRLIEAELDRKSWILAVGGGVAGDMAGFVAATFLRGVDWVQVPTTIVAQVDASIGGKTAVNHELGKNMIGSFHQPRMVLTDTEFLRTLPRPERVAGLAEVVKHAVIRDDSLFAFLEKHLEEVVEMEIDADGLDWLIGRNAEIKAAVIEADEKEGDLRAILNYGHTIGHAIESVGHGMDPTSDYGRYRHGEAVILGMAAAAEIAQRRGLWSPADRRRQDALLERLGVPPGIAGLPVDRIVKRTRADKKRLDGNLRFVLPRRIGEVALVDDVDEETVRAGVLYIQERYP